MKIGEKEYSPVYTNRTIYEIEEAFDNTPISKIMLDVENFTTQQLGKIIWHGIKRELTWDEFIDTIEVSQYTQAGVDCGNALAKAFDIGTKKK